MIGRSMLGGRIRLVRAGDSDSDAQWTAYIPAGRVPEGQGRTDLDAARDLAGALRDLAARIEDALPRSKE